MDNTGLFIKNQLGLSKLSNVRIGRLLMATYRVYLIVYDTKFPNRPITNSEVRGLSYLLPAMQYPFEEKPTLLPLLDLKDFNGSYSSSMFFAFDLAGRYSDKSKLSKVFEGTSTPLHSFFFGSLYEYITFADLNSPESLSDLTARTRKTRNRASGTENKLAKLIDINIDTVEDHITFVFKTQATTPIYPKDAKFKKTRPSDFKLVHNASKEYDMYLRVLNFFEWLKGTKPDAEKITQQDVKDVIRINNIQLFSTSPSFHWQGFNYWLSQLDGSAYPTDIAPQTWDKIHGDGEAFLDKHLYGLIRQIAFFSNPMASMLTKRLKDRELI